MFKRGEQGSYMPHRAGCVEEGWARGEERRRWGEGRKKEERKEKRTVAEQEP